MTQTPDELRAEAKRLELKADEQTISKSLEGELAVLLHKHRCGYNHTDGCAWGYEERDDSNRWEAPAHKRYLEQARKMLASDKLAGKLAAEYQYAIDELQRCGNHGADVRLRDKGYSLLARCREAGLEVEDRD